MINRTKIDIKPAVSGEKASPWDIAVVEALEAEAAAQRSQRWWQAAPSHITDISKAVDWAVACFAIGIALYFGAPFEPSLTLMAALAFGALIIWAVSERREVPWVAIPLIAFAIFGFARATWHTQASPTPFLDEGFYTVTGWVEAVEKSGKGERWRIRVHEIEGRGIARQGMADSGVSASRVKTVRIKIHKGEARGGDGIRVSAMLSAPPGPVVPGGYDPARKAYFAGLSAYGFSTSAAEPYAVPSRSLTESAARRLTRFRYALADRIRAQSPENTAGLQVALLTGIRSFIPPEQTEALRAAGLAHVLAISGLHMGLLAGGAYGFASLLLSMIGPLARRYDMRKVAAVIGALAATAYLLLSGASVATQRAYVMALIVFLAVILDRRAFSIRSVSIAALITLLWHPEALMSVGFQMSFAAVIALVVVYRNWHGPAVERGNIVQRFGSGLASLSITSFVAGTATSVYALMHFNRMAKYGFVGNLLAMPIFTFLVMPAALVTLIAMPFGLEWAPLQIMGWALSLLLAVSNWVASWPGALAHIKSPPAWIIALYSLGFLWLCLGERRLKLASTAIFAVCVGVWALTPVPDMRVSDSGRVAVWNSKTDPEVERGGERAAERQTLYVSSKRADKYGREQFIQRAGLSVAEVEKYEDTLALCDALACRFEIKGKRVSIVSHPSEVPQECEYSDVVILTTREAGPIARRNCKARLIGKRELKANGAYDIYLSGKNVRFKTSLSQMRARRPWGKQAYRRD